MVICASFAFGHSQPLDSTTDLAILSPMITSDDQETDRPPVMPADVEVSPQPTDSQPVSTQPAVQAVGSYEVSSLLRALAPALVAIFIAVFTRQVLVALPLGILTASITLMVMDGVFNPLLWVTNAIDRYLFKVLAFVNQKGELDNDKLWIVIFTLFIGAMVGVIEANGGTRAMVARVTRHMKTRQRCQLGCWFAGLLIFFDDYANAMIVGPSMRPVFDRLRLSREKLAYIVDSTAAPVASVFIGTWLVSEITFIDDGLKELTERPGFLAKMSGSTAFWASLPYRTYAWLALVMVFLIALTGRDFGPMRKAERRCLDLHESDGTPTKAHQAGQDGSMTSDRNDGRGWWLGAIPVAFLVFAAVGLLIQSGWSAMRADGRHLELGSWDMIKVSVGDLLHKADAYSALLYASFSAAVIAVLLTQLSGALPLKKTMDAVSAGMSRMFGACVVLVLAWGLSKASQDLHLGDVAGNFLKQLEQDQIFSASFLPLATFITAAIVSFATGTSWGAMGILCPAVISIAARLFADMPEDQALTLFYATVGAVLTGAVFGDHCSPISDTTVLSSIASECDLGKHVWTQLPYALIVAVVGILCTDFLHYGLNRWANDFYLQYEGWIVYLGTVAGAIMLFFIVLIVGRRPFLPPVPVRPVPMDRLHER